MSLPPLNQNDTTSILSTKFKDNSLLFKVLGKSEKFKSACPADALPATITEILSHYSSIKGYPIDYLFGSIITASGGAIGNSHYLNTVNGYRAVSNVFMAIIGRRGFNKSEAIEDAFLPIKHYQARLYEAYKNAPKDENGRKPIFAKPLISDATIEALAAQLDAYPNGNIIVCDELAGFLKNFNKYSGAGDEQKYLEIWSNKSITIDRKTTGSVYLEKPFLSIIGTIQPEIAEQVFNGKEESGFFDRWLLIQPERVVKQYPTNKGLNPVIVGKWKTIINNLIALSLTPGYEIEPTLLTYSSEAWQIIYQWICQNTDKENDSNTSPTEGGIRAKMEIYIHRFALINQMLMFATGESLDREKISELAAQRAVRWTDYFYSHAEKNRLTDKAELLPKHWRDVFEMLPNGTDFKTSDFLQMCDVFKIPEKTAKTFLKNNSDKTETKLLTKLKHGIYIKSNS